MNDAITIPTNTAPTIEIDWEQYFRDFCEKHGKYPIVHDGLLLFPDGWRYSMSDYQGPEYPPPTNKEELDWLLFSYWNRRYKIVDEECRQLSHTYFELLNLSRNKSAPLKHTITYADDDGKMRTESHPIDMDMIKRRIDWLAKDVKEALENVKKYSIPR